MVTTAQILAERAMQQPCDEQCVDWAIRLLESGHESVATCRLAAKLPPHNHFELASLRDQILEELGQTNISDDAAITGYVAEMLTDAIDDRSDLDAVLAEIKDMCIANDYQSDIYDFYLLYFARLDLREQQHQYYWPEADRSNIETITRNRIREFIDQHRIAG